MIQDHFWHNVFFTLVYPLFGPKTALFKAFWELAWVHMGQQQLKTTLNHLSMHPQVV